VGRVVTTQDELIRRLDAIDGGDPDGAHGEADDLLLEAMPEEVRQAYMRLVKRCRWWATA